MFGLSLKLKVCLVCLVSLVFLVEPKKQEKRNKPINGSRFSGDYGGGETPVPIPNTAVKPSRADDTAGVTLWESRSLPGLSLKENPKGEIPWGFLLNFPHGRGRSAFCA